MFYENVIVAVGTHDLYPLISRQGASPYCFLIPVLSLMQRAFQNF